MKILTTSDKSIHFRRQVTRYKVYLLFTGNDHLARWKQSWKQLKSLPVKVIMGSESSKSEASQDPKTPQAYTGAVELEGIKFTQPPMVRPTFAPPPPQPNSKDKTK